MLLDFLLTNPFLEDIDEIAYTVRLFTDHENLEVLAVTLIFLKLEIMKDPSLQTEFMASYYINFQYLWKVIWLTRGNLDETDQELWDVFKRMVYLIRKDINIEKDEFDTVYIGLLLIENIVEAVKQENLQAEILAEISKSFV